MTVKTQYTKTQYSKSVSNKELDTSMIPTSTTEAIEVVKLEEVKNSFSINETAMGEAVPTPQSEITPPVVTNVEIVKEKTKNDLDVPTLLATIRESGTVFEKMTLTGLDIYKKNMAPRVPVDPNDGAKYQNGLWKVLQSVLENAPENEFTKIWSVILIYIHAEQEGVFNDRYLYRFAEHWGWDLDELKTFQRIMHLVTLTADSKTRKENLKKVTITKVIATGFSERAKQRITNYYLN
jgi:hypothetical protein